LKNFDKILSKSKDLNDFRIFDTDMEWKNFLSVSGIGSVPAPEAKIVEFDTSSNRQIVYMLAFAASIILIFAAVFVLKKPDAGTVEFAAGNTAGKVQLIDGSTVNVEAGSKLSYFTSLQHAEKREVKLDGEASFDISKSILPFRVYHKDIFVDVLGTEFSITDSAEGILIKNTSGSVRVSETKNPSNNITLKAGDAFLYKNGLFTDTRKPEVKEEPAPVVVAPAVKKQVKEKPVVQAAPVKEEPAAPAPVLRRFKLESVIKDYLLKFNKKKVKMDKSNKPDLDKIVSIDNIDKPYFELLKDLKKQGVIDFEAGDCPDCYIIKAPVKNE